MKEHLSETKNTQLDSTNKTTPIVSGFRRCVWEMFGEVLGTCFEGSGGGF